MRYRPFGRTGNATSAVSLHLGDAVLAQGRSGSRQLLVQALEAGVNTFVLESADPVLAELAGDVLNAVDRRLVFLGVRVGRSRRRNGFVRDFSPESVTSGIDQVIALSGLGHVDLVLLEEPGEEELPQATLSALKAQRKTERITALGVMGAGEVMDAYVSTGAFDVLATPFDLNASWATRNRIRAAVERDMAVIAYDYYPRSLSTPKKAEEHGQPRRGLFGWGAERRLEQDTALKGAGTFAFLHQTQGWTAEDICLAQVLTDPTIASVIIDAADSKRLEQLSDIPERTLPPGLPAQIEMARLSLAQARSA